MDRETDMDEDLRLAISLSENEWRSSQRTTRTTSEEDDYLYALKLSRELNSSPMLSSDVAQLESDFSLAKELAQAENEIVSKKNATSNIKENHLPAMKLSGEAQADDSLREAKKVKIEDDFPDDISDSEFELALRFAESESSTSSKISTSAVNVASGERSEPAFDSAIDDHDLLSIAQLYETTNNSDFELVNALPAANNAKVKRKLIEKKTLPVKTNPDTYMNKTLSVVDPSWETIDPNPDIYALFIAFNRRFFWGRLDMVEVKWSPRMTLCAGICSYRRRAGHCVVKLSKPLLTYRPRKDLVETLLHEMIHAYLFVTNNDRDRDGHGPRFHEHMYRINKESGSNITVYHSFHDEVKLYKTHVWKCDGPCQGWKPFYGLVKRSMNRVPGPNDLWWANHAATCGGKFHKIKEPENYGKKKGKKKSKTDPAQNSDISKFLSPKKSSSATSTVTGASLSSVSNFEGSLLGSTLSATSNGSKSNSIPKSTSLINTNAHTSPPIPNTGNLFRRNPMSTVSNTKIVTLADLSKSKRKRSPTRSPTKSPKKWMPIPGQKNILSFVNKSS